MRWLTRRGATAALAVGAATLWGVGWRGGLLLLAFFISANLLSRKTSRSERQVIANGGIAALAALAGSWAGFAGALAAATADTWATEIGRHARAAPRLITTGRPVLAGTDGGITLLGTLGGIAGAACISGGAVLLTHSRTFVSVGVAGSAGMLLDSLLGATAQGAVKWMDNDAVNLAATLAGAAIAALWRACC
ncbi:MAG: DUF92 domain-containing protein [Gemmatimonadales bacterium]